MPGHSEDRLDEARPFPTWGWIAILLGVAVISGLAGVAIDRQFALSAQRRDEQRVLRSGLLSRIDSMPRPGEGDLAVTATGPNTLHRQIYHWAASETNGADTQKPETWLDEMETWCATTHRIVDRCRFTTEEGGMMVVSFDSKELAGSLLCFAGPTGKEGRLKCVAVIFETMKLRIPEPAIDLR